MLKNNIYNTDKEFDYATIKDMVVKSLEKIGKEEAFKNRFNIPDDAISNYADNGDLKNINFVASPTPLLKLKIRNTTKYLYWRLMILKRDNFTCQLCLSSIKENKSLRLEVHHAKTFDDICKENKICTVEQALACKELWNLNNGVSICYSCHKGIEKLRTKLRNMFVVKQTRE
jgi:hypothetical protein